MLLQALLFLTTPLLIATTIALPHSNHLAPNAPQSFSLFAITNDNSPTTNYTITHVPSSPGIGFIALHPVISSPSSSSTSEDSEDGDDSSTATAQLMNGRLLVDGYEAVLDPSLLLESGGEGWEQVGTVGRREGEKSGSGNVVFRMTDEGEIVIIVENDTPISFYACPALVTNGNAKVSNNGNGMACAEIPSPCVEEGSATLWVGREGSSKEEKEKEMPVRGCRMVSVMAA